MLNNEKMAIIEIDSSYMKLSLFHKFNGIYFTVFDESINYVKIGEDINKDGFLKPVRIKEVLEVLKGYKKICEAHNIHDVTVYCSYATRKAKNQTSFVDEISSSFGFKVRVLNEGEELNSVYTGVFNTLDVPKALIVDMGSESTNLILYARRNILFQKTLNFGANTISEKFEDEQDIIRQGKLTYDYFRSVIKEITELKNIDEEYVVVGTGYIAEATARLSKNVKKYPLDVIHNYTMEEKDFEDVLSFLSSLNLDSKKRLRGISDERADVISNAIYALKGVFDEVALNNFVVSSHSKSYGLILNLVNPQTLEKPITDILGYSLETQNKYFVESETNSEHVYELAMILFKQLRVLHKLPRTYVKSLRVASYMHDAGMRINFFNHSKLNYNVIIYGNIFGVTHRELLVAGFIASSEDSVNFSIAEFSKYRDILTDEDLDAIKKLGVIIKIAEGMDRSGLGLIKDVNCDILGDSVILKAVSDSDVTLEIREALQAKNDFMRAYKKNLEIL